MARVYSIYRTINLNIIGSEISCAILLLTVAPLAFAQTEALPTQESFYLLAGSGGLGIGVSKFLNQRWSVRADVAQLAIPVQQSTSPDLRLAGTLRLQEAGAFFDYRPGPEAGPWRITAGLMGASPSLKLDGVYVDHTWMRRFYSGDIAVNARAKVRSPMPFLGMGWGLGQHKQPAISYFFDVGLGFGGVDGELNATPPARFPSAGAGIFRDTLNAERARFVRRFDGAKFWPVLKFGVSYAF